MWATVFYSVNKSVSCQVSQSTTYQVNQLIIILVNESVSQQDSQSASHSASERVYQ